MDEHTTRRLRIALHGCYARGWQPAELIRHIRSFGRSDATELATWLIADDHQRHDPATVDPRWAEQVRTLGGVRRRPATSVAVNVGRVLESMFSCVVPLDVLIQPPGRITPMTAVRDVGRHTRADPMLEKVRALLAKAESTEFEAEAAAFTAKAQDLMTRHAIDQITVDQSTLTPDEPSMTRLLLDAPYVDAKSTLLQVVAVASRCQSLSYRTPGLMALVGYPSDLEVAQLLFTSLLVQAQQALTAAISGAVPGAHRRSAGFKSAFLVGFAHRVDDRLQEVNRLVHASAAAGNFLPVLQSREQRITDYLVDHFGATRQRRRHRDVDREGFSRGTVAADAARLTAAPLER